MRVASQVTLRQGQESSCSTVSIIVKGTVATMTLLVNTAAAYGVSKTAQDSAPWNAGVAFFVIEGIVLFSGLVACIVNGITPPDEVPGLMSREYTPLEQV